jgi:hypothetical protein
LQWQQVSKLKITRKHPSDELIAESHVCLYYESFKLCEIDQKLGLQEVLLLLQFNKASFSSTIYGTSSTCLQENKI